MKYYEQMVNLGCFKREDVVNMTGSVEAAKSILFQYTQKGYIEKIRRDYYVAISMESHQPVASRYEIASNLYDDAYLTHHSAFEVYGYANQTYYDVYLTTEKRVTPFEYDGVSYHRTVKYPNAQIVQSGNIKLTGIEQTVVDSIKDYEKISGLEEVLRCIELIPSLDEGRILQCLYNHNNGYLYQKCGYIFDSLGNPFGFSKEFEEECLAHIALGKRPLLKTGEGLIFDKKWLLYVPVRLQSLIEKGAFGYNEI